MRKSLSPTAGVAVAVGCTLGLSAAPARAQQVIWEDDFPTTSGTVDASKWDVSDNSAYIHRTHFGEAPQVLAEGNTTFARLRMESYNPNSPGSFLGTEMWSHPQWTVGTGLQWEARVRGTNVPKGIVYAFFTYRRHDYNFDRDKEEVDFEFLSNWVNDPAASNKIWTNIWNSGSGAEGTNIVAGLDQTQWHTYTIRWRPNGVEWLVDGALVRTETQTVPDDEMAVCLNLWAPDYYSPSTGHFGWDKAYDASLTTTSPPAATKTNYFDVDYVRVARLPALLGQGSLGSGDGLTGQYYNSVYTGASNAPQYFDERFGQVSRRLDFNWGNTPFDPRQGKVDSNSVFDNWGATFKGEVQAQFSEPTTFSLKTQSSDGVRLWLDNQLVINKAPAAGADSEVESTYTTPNALQAGAHYAIRVEFWDGTGAASLKLAWNSASLPRQLISATQLYPVILPTPQLSPLPGSYATAQVVSATVPEAGVDLHYTLDGSEPQRTSALIPAGGSISVASSADLRVKAWKDGFWASATAGGAYAIDGTPPVLALAVPTDASSYKSLASASGSASDSGSGVDRVSARLSRGSDGAFWNGSTAASTWGPQVDIAATVSNGTWSVALPALVDGSYTLRVQGVDRAGNLSLPLVATFLIDGSAPVVSVDAPTEGSFYTSLTVASGQATDNGPGIPEVRASLKRADGAFWDGRNWVAGPVDVATDFSAAPAWKLALPALAEGSYTLTIRASDQARNTTTLVRPFTIDAGAPSVVIGGPSDGSVLKSAFVLNGSSSDAVSGVASVGVHVQRASDGAFWSPSTWGAADVEMAARTSSSGATGADWTLPLPLFADGAYSAVVVARDRVGNVASSIVRWRMDSTPPLVSVADPLQSAQWSAWIAPRGSASDGDGSGVARVDLSLRNGGAFWDGASWVGSEAKVVATLNGASWVWPASAALPPAVDGAYEVIATATDGAGYAATAQTTFTLVVPAPAPTATPLPTATPVATVPTATPVPTSTPAPTAVPTATPVPAPIDGVLPRASVVSPPNGSMWRVLPSVRGLVSDNVGVVRSQVSLFRYSDRRYWNGSSWVAGAIVLQPSLSGNAQSSVWSISRLPSGTSLQPGLYGVTITVADGTGLRASDTSIFRIDGRAPMISFVLPSASARVISAPPSSISVRAADDASGTRSVSVMLWRRSDRRYWNGRAWSAGLARLSMRAVNPTLGLRPSAVLWQNAFAMPPASQWLPGSYVLSSSASDWASNASTSSLEFTLAPPSPFALSSVSAQASASAITLAFTGPLDAAVAQAPARFRATVGGVARQVLSARYSAATRSVTLVVVGGMAPGDRVQAWWSGLLDTSARSLRNGTAALNAG